MKPWFLAVLVILQLTAPLLAAGRPMTVDDLLAVKGGRRPPALARRHAGRLRRLRARPRHRQDQQRASGSSRRPGGEPKQLTTAPGTNNHPRWSPDGKTIAFVSNRGGSAQVWLLPIDGGEARQLTKLPIDVSGPDLVAQGRQARLHRRGLSRARRPSRPPRRTRRRKRPRARSASTIA